MDKLIITEAITGAATVPSLSPHLPLTPREVADSAIEAAEAGAAIVHVHARRPEDGFPSSNPEHFREILTRIKEKSDVVGKKIKELEYPKGSIIIAIYDKNQLIVPDPDFQMREGEKILILAKKSAVKKVRKTFG